MKFRISSILALLLALCFTEIRAQTTEIIYLSGTAYNNTREWDFFCSDGMNSKEWGKIAVPSQWEQQGYGNYTYGRWYIQKGSQPSMETGQYRTSFFAPADWKSKVVRIVFEGVMTDTKVKINNEQAGEIHQGGFYRFSYDITQLIKPGEENQLEVFVSKHSEDRTVNAAERMADWWLFGGIYRPVYLEILPEMHISGLKLDPKANGTLTSYIDIDNLSDKAEINCTLKDLNGNILGSNTTSLKGRTSPVKLSAAYDNIEAWTPETPNLYQVEFSLIEKNRTIHTVNERIGFRTIEVRPSDGIYCNGTKIVLKGINRHTFWPESGRCTGKDISILDAELIKEMNMNAVRSHYPPDEHFLDACDSLGLFYIDELAGWQNAYRTETGTKLLKEMIDRDVNHPCIILWSNGNEGGWNEEIDHLFSEIDPQKREVIHPWADFKDIDTHHYPQYQTGIHRFTNGYKIFMPTEFLHGLYDEGHGAGLEDFWSKWTAHPLFAGGFLWAYNDCAIKRSDSGIHDSDGQHAPDGVVGPYREKEGSFFTIKDIWSPIQFDPVYITSSFTGEFLVTNKYLYTDLEDCSMTYDVISIPGPYDKNGSSEVIANGKIILPSIPPGEKRKVKMDLPANFFSGDILSVSAFDPSGKEIYTWTWPLKYAKDFFRSKSTEAASEGTKSRTSFSISGDKVSLIAGPSEVRFDASKGIIDQMIVSGKILPLSGGPVPVGMKAEADHFEVRQENDRAVLTVWYKGGIDSIRWEITPERRLRMSMLALNNYRNDGGFDGGFVADKIDVLGLSFNFPEEEAREVTWFGKGPYRVWKNRQRGTSYGLWSKAYNNTITGESFENLVYPEFKGYHADIYWASLKTKNTVPLTLFSESNGVFLRLFTPEEPSGALKRSLPAFPDGDISLLYEINPIHAFKPVSQMGPNSEPGTIRIKKGDEGISMTVWFDLNEN